jgi:hypothetical protein
MHSSVRLQIVRIPLAFFVGLVSLCGFAGGAAAQSPYPPGMTEPEICRSEVMWARSAASVIHTDWGQRLRRFIDTGFTFLRYDRRQEAIRRLDLGVKLVERESGPWRLPAEESERTLKYLQALRECFLTSKIPPLTTLTVRVFRGDELAEKKTPAGRGVEVRVEEQRIGTTGRDSSITARVPSGTIEILAIDAPYEVGGAYATLRPGGRTTFSIVMREAEDYSEYSAVVVDEAVGGVVPAATRSLAFRFVNDDDTSIKIVDVHQINLKEPRPDGFDDDITKLFRAEEGVIRAVDPAAIVRLANGGDITLSILAMDITGARLWDRISFRFR